MAGAIKAKIRSDAMRWLSLWVAFVALVLFAAMISAGPATAESLSSSAVSKAVSSDKPVLKPRIEAAYGKLPLSFEANQGQSNAQVKFLSHGLGYSLFLTPKEAVLALRALQKAAAPGTHATAAKLAAPDATRASDAKGQASAEIDTTVVRIQLLGANPSPHLIGEEVLAGRSNYLIGNDPKRWHTNIPQYAKVRYQAVYPGIDVVYYVRQSAPARVRLRGGPRCRPQGDPP
jgi:hypothetical protein